MYKRLIYLTCFALVLVALPLVTLAQVENLASNPSFEEDEVILDDPEWLQWATGGYESGLSSTVEIDETEFIDGKRSLRVIPTGDTNWYFIVLNLPIYVDINKDYTVSFWAKAEEPRPLTVQFKATDNSIAGWGATDFELTTQWAEYHYASEVLIDNVKLEIFCSGSEVPFWLDYVYVYEGDYVPGINPTPPLKSSEPDPADGAFLEQTWVTLGWQATPPSVSATAPAARLTILGDNTVARDGVKAVWGFACLVEARGHTVLFDTGADPTVLKDNLAALKVDPARIEAVVISHFHPDHTGGAPGLGKLAGVRVFTPRDFEDFAKLRSAGLKEDVARKIADWQDKEIAALQSTSMTLVPVSQTTPLFDGITVSEPLALEAKMPTDKPGQEFTYKFWEQCLTVDTPDGLVVIAGCAHPGILPMLEQVKRQTGRPLYLVIGGFHLLDQPEAEVRQIAKAMQAMGVAYVSATHCTGKAAVRVFRDVFRDRYVSAGVGAVIDLPFTATSAVPALAQNQIDRIAESYVKLVLAVGQYDPEYVDSYYGPPEWQEQAAARKIALGDIRPQVVRTSEELAAINPSGLGEMEKLRLRFMSKQLDSVKTRIDMLAGVKMKFDEESAALFDAVAPDYPDAHFEAQLARSDALLPGTGTLRERYEKFRQRFLIPKDKVEPVFRTAMQEARQRTRRYIQLPEGENIRIECVTGKPWTASSRCQGNGQSVVQLNTDVPYTIDELLTLACHEGYPGHHVTVLLLDDRLVRRQGWREFSVVPLPSPLLLIMEGTADDALELAFPIAERINYERDVLYPLAGLDPALANSAAPVFDVTHSLSNPWLSEASPVAARRYLDGVMGRSEMLEWLKARTLVPQDQLELMAQFISRYRSYIICYSVGRDLVKHHIEKHAGADREKQWQEFERLQTPPRSPSDLLKDDGLPLNVLETKN